jgi:hypothetical protein
MKRNSMRLSENMLTELAISIMMIQIVHTFSFRVNYCPDLERIRFFTPKKYIK